MFGLYEMEYEGRRYFGNVILREFHIFDYDGGLYLVDVGKMAAYPISSLLAAMIGRVYLASGSLVPESVMMELRKLKLIAGEDEAPYETPPSGESGASGRKAEFAVVNIAFSLPRSAICAVSIVTATAGNMRDRG